MGALPTVLSNLNSNETQKPILLHKKEIKIVTVMRTKWKLPQTKTKITLL